MRSVALRRPPNTADQLRGPRRLFAIADLVSCIRLFAGPQRLLRDVLLEVHGTVEHTQDTDLVGRLPDVHDSVVTPKQDSHLPTGRSRVRMPDVGELDENLRALVQRLHDFERGGRLVRGDVVVDTEKPPLSLGGPDYLRQDSIRRPISSWEMVRPASESASPRSTIAANASSRTISSSEESSGWSWIRRISCSLTGLMPRLYPRPAQARRTPRSAASGDSMKARAARQ